MKYLVKFKLGHGTQENILDIESVNGEIIGTYDSQNPDFGPPKAIESGSIAGDVMTIKARPSRALFIFEGRLSDGRWEGEITVSEEHGGPPPMAMEGQAPGPGGPGGPPGVPPGGLGGPGSGGPGANNTIPFTAIRIE